MLTYKHELGQYDRFLNGKKLEQHQQKQNEEETHQLQPLGIIRFNVF